GETRVTGVAVVEPGPRLGKVTAHAMARDVVGVVDPGPPVGIRVVRRADAHLALEGADRGAPEKALGEGLHDGAPRGDVEEGEDEKEGGGHGAWHRSLLRCGADDCEPR